MSNTIRNFFAVTLFLTVLTGYFGVLIFSVAELTMPDDAFDSIDREWYYAEAAWIEQAEHFGCDASVTFHADICEPRK